jgi:hypothetical protein
MNNLCRVKGYYGNLELYQFVEEEMQPHKPDFRNTLFWSPLIIKDHNGEACKTFYCSDINTVFAGLIKSVGDNGLLDASTFDLRVLNLLPVNHKKTENR